MRVDLAVPASLSLKSDLDLPVSVTTTALLRSEETEIESAC